MSDGLNGYYVDTIENPTTDYLDCTLMEGYNNKLYFPHQDAIDNGSSDSYWLASPSSNGINLDNVMGVDCFDGVILGECELGSLAARPVISLPTSILE